MPDSSNPNITSTTQPTLWDNISLESGYRCLSELRFGEAIAHFEKAMEILFERKAVLEAMEAARYWQPQIEHAQPGLSGQLIDNYKSFSFAPLLKKFQRQLLFFIVDNLSGQRELRKRLVEAAFDLLLEMKEYKRAELFISACIGRYPQIVDWLYLIAQAQWRGKLKSDATVSYLTALLYRPVNIPMHRIESDEIKNLLAQYGAAMSPAYAWIKGIAPFIPFDAEPVTGGGMQNDALKIYLLLRMAHQCFEKNDLKSAIAYRRQLKELNPKLYADYFAALKQQR